MGKAAKSAKAFRRPPLPSAPPSSAQLRPLDRIEIFRGLHFEVEASQRRLVLELRLELPRAASNSRSTPHTHNSP